jgi:hypothetical protein
VKKRGVELKVMRGRLKSEMIVKEPINDEYGKDRINAMIADIHAQYAAMGVNVGVTHDTGVVGTEGDEDVEEEENDSDHEPRSSKRYVYFHANNQDIIGFVPSALLLFPHADAESTPALLPSNRSATTTGVAASPPTTRTVSLSRPSPDSVPSRTLLSKIRRRRSCLLREGVVRSSAQMLRLRRVSVIKRMKDIVNRRSMLGT